MNILEYANKELKVELTFLQQDLLLTLQGNSDFVKFIQKKSYDMVVVLNVYYKWKEHSLVCA
ncbi:hypothetical protein [Paenibacillus sp. FSL H7-0331]|uniref:hypothetical protein n=1 Tax=Paenibacillus sp. FSL H7-0331 TaxID=1920421 RepID=UPI00096DE124|nr:hypothetical protein [Paenibacillus sp. FSL H7-0331]OME97324.1 hypothetical protein BK127_40910 [Paenibacillus sp. FSL H7-0331]